MIGKSSINRDHNTSQIIVCRHLLICGFVDLHELKNVAYLKFRPFRFTLCGYLFIYSWLLF